jgi:mannose-6-phosphate isomerase-like protein (cupin superfamily)
MVINHFQKKKWGHEVWIVNNDLYCGKILCIETHWQVSYHCHVKKHETFHILDGCIYFKYDGIEFKMNKGMTIVVPQNTFHSFGGLTTYPSYIIEVSTPHDEEDSYRADESHFVGHDEYTRWSNLPFYSQNMLIKCGGENECILPS